MKRADAKTILCVEDDAFIVQILTHQFEKEGFSVLTAKDGAEGLAIALRDHPDLILLDIILPVMDGLTMLKQIRGDPWGKKVPVVMLTNFSDPDKIAKAKEYQVREYLLKIDMALPEVVQKVKAQLGA